MLYAALWPVFAAELDRRRIATSTPDMKLVISMSYGSSAETAFSKQAIKSLAKQRSDVLWIAAAGNSGDNSTNYPAGYDEVSSCEQQRRDQGRHDMCHIKSVAAS